jgi:hypothetical protein
MTHTIPYGTSEPQDFQLNDDGEPLVGTGIDVELEIARSGGGDVGSPAPVVAWLSQATGTVRVTGVEVLEVGSYRVRYKLTDSSDNVGYCPNGEAADDWDVVRVVT